MNLREEALLRTYQAALDAQARYDGMFFRGIYAVLAFVLASVPAALVATANGSVAGDIVGLGLAFVTAGLVVGGFGLNILCKAALLNEFALLRLERELGLERVGERHTALHVRPQDLAEDQKPAGLFARGAMRFWGWAAMSCSCGWRSG